MSEEQQIAEIEEMLRQGTEVYGLQTPLVSADYIGDEMWIPVSPTAAPEPAAPEPAPIPTRVTIRMPPRKRSHSGGRAKSRRASPRTAPKVATPAMTIRAAPTMQIPAAPTMPPTRWMGLGDPLEFAMDGYDKVIAPTISDKTEVRTKMRRHLYRRIISEVVNGRLIERAKVAVITIDEVVNVMFLACEQVGLKFEYSRA